MSSLASRVFYKHVAIDVLQLTARCNATLMSRLQTNTEHRQVSAHNTHTSIMGVTQLRSGLKVLVTQMI